MITDSTVVTKPKKSRRKFLNLITHGYIAVGAAFAAVPFIKSFNPSQKAKAIGAPVDIDISDLLPNQLKVVKWRGKPVWVLRRDEEVLQTLKIIESDLQDPGSIQSDQPDFAANRHRSLKPEFLVLVGVCTHLGCSPLFKPQKGTEELGKDWPGGFFCPCHGSKFDFSGRVFKNLPAPTNLVVPPYAFVDDKTIRVGVTAEEIA